MAAPSDGQIVSRRPVVNLKTRPLESESLVAPAFALKKQKVSTVKSNTGTHGSVQQGLPTADILASAINSFGKALTDVVARSRFNPDHPEGNEHAVKAARLETEVAFLKKAAIDEKEHKLLEQETQRRHSKERQEQDSYIRSLQESRLEDVKRAHEQTVHLLFGQQRLTAGMFGAGSHDAPNMTGPGSSFFSNTPSAGRISHAAAHNSLENNIHSPLPMITNGEKSPPVADLYSALRLELYEHKKLADAGVIEVEDYITLKSHVLQVFKSRFADPSFKLSVVLGELSAWKQQGLIDDEEFKHAKEAAIGIYRPSGEAR